jgi:single-strand DNA-binding protein
MVVIGSIQNDNYTDNNGNQRYSVQIIVDEMEFAESKSAQSGDSFGGNGGSNFGGSYNRTNNYNNAAASRPAPAPVGDGFMNIPDGVEDEDLPFN